MSYQDRILSLRATGAPSQLYIAGHMEAKGYAADIAKEADQTIATLTRGLNTLAAELGIEPANDGTDATLIDRCVGRVRELEAMRKDAGLYRGLHSLLLRENPEIGEGYLILKCVGCPPTESQFYEAIEKALAGGEAE